jgi:leucyl-tRNA synthetase
MDAAHTFRIHLKHYMTPKKSSKEKDHVTDIEKPTQGIIWVAKTYPNWQSITLTTMREMYSVSLS